MLSVFKNREKPRVANRFATVAHDVKRLVYGQTAQFLIDDIIAVDLAKYFFHDHQTAPIPWTNDWRLLSFFADIFEDWSMPSECGKFLEKNYKHDAEYAELRAYKKQRDIAKIFKLCYILASEEYSNRYASVIYKEYPKAVFDASYRSKQNYDTLIVLRKALAKLPTDLDTQDAIDRTPLRWLTRTGFSHYKTNFQMFPEAPGCGPNIRVDDKGCWVRRITLQFEPPKPYATDRFDSEYIKEVHRRYSEANEFAFKFENFKPFSSSGFPKGIGAFDDMVGDPDDPVAFLIFRNPPKFGTLHSVIMVLKETWKRWDHTIEVLVLVALLKDVLEGLARLLDERKVVVR
eukprot:TRINITY_DN7143_c0_g1_i1.p1 TRINITY_DN7143_c0_g1~~TRINITY_DN7143_c0_g1_i1.p1  ORF type:complete len:346 (-),score=68.30 TRINITY_DN7143_c0_g1_i1:130-1167(-)